MAKHFTLPYEGGLIDENLPAGILHSYEKIWTNVFQESRVASYRIADIIIDSINAHTDGLFRLGVIDCSGGPRMKWRTATGIFLHADGSPFDTTLKNSRCTNPEKHKLLQNLVFTPLEDAIAHRGA